MIEGRAQLQLRGLLHDRGRQLLRRRVGMVAQGPADGRPQAAQLSGRQWADVGRRADEVRMIHAVGVQALLQVRDERRRERGIHGGGSPFSVRG